MQSRTQNILDKAKGNLELAIKIGDLMYFLITNDVECHSIPLNRIDINIASEIYKEGLPRLLDLLAKYEVCSTFYFTGKFCEQSPESVDLVKAHGHSSVCHGYDHSPQNAYDLLSYDKQVSELKKAKKVIEPLAGKLTSFRAPALRIKKGERDECSRGRKTYRKTCSKNRGKNKI